MTLGHFRAPSQLHMLSCVVVGAIGFEPTTYGTQNRRATRLRYAPTKA